MIFLVMFIFFLFGFKFLYYGYVHFLLGLLLYHLRLGSCFTDVVLFLIAPVCSAFSFLLDVQSQFLLVSLHSTISFSLSPFDCRVFASFLCSCFPSTDVSLTGCAETLPMISFPGPVSFPSLSSSFISECCLVHLPAV